MICPIRCFFIFSTFVTVAIVAGKTPPVAGLRRGVIVALQVILGLHYIYIGLLRRLKSYLFYHNLSFFFTIVRNVTN
jgi:hypothetical protein